MKRALLVLATVAHPAPAQAQAIRCGTRVALEQRVPVALPARAALARKVMRDAFGRPPHARRTANFALKWGDQGGPVPDATVDAILSALEAAWAHETGAMELPVPAGSEAALFNVYLYGTGLAVPDFGFSAYTGVDDQGYPFIVLPPDLDLADPAGVDLMQVTAAHEFFHAIQMRIGAYEVASNPGAYWYWEATADWMATQVWPDSPVAREYTPFYLLAPHIGIGSVVFPDADDFQPEMLHHYGAAMLPTYLSERAADWTLVRDSWTAAGPGDDPLRVLARLLAPRALDDIFVDFAAANAVLDVPDRALVARALAKARASYPDYDRSIAVRLSADDGVIDAPAATLPEAWAYNVIAVDGDVQASIEPATTGSAGTPARLTSRVVVDRDATWLVVVSEPDRTIAGETFPYRIAVTRPPPDDTEPPVVMDDGGCSAGGSTPSCSWAVLFVLLLIERRRHRLRHPGPVVVSYRSMRAGT